MNEIAKVVAILLVLILAGFNLYKYYFIKIEIPTSSMYPLIKEGSSITVIRLNTIKRLKRGDLLVFRSTESFHDEDKDKLLIKRLIGLPGDLVELKKGELYVNGEKIHEPYVVNKQEFTGIFKVPPEKYFFLGDNRKASFDSRYWSYHYINGKEIIAKAIIK